MFEDTRYAHKALGLLRIVAALLFLLHGTSKLFAVESSATISLSSSASGVVRKTASLPIRRPPEATLTRSAAAKVSLSSKYSWTTAVVLNGHGFAVVKTSSWLS